MVHRGNCPLVKTNYYEIMYYYFHVQMMPNTGHISGQTTYLCGKTCIHKHKQHQLKLRQICCIIEQTSKFDNKVLFTKPLGTYGIQI